MKNLQKNKVIDFDCKGICCHKNKILAFGDYDCKIGDLDTFASEYQDVVGGFDGIVKYASFVDLQSCSCDR